MRLKKIRKIFRILFPKQMSVIQLFEFKLRSNNLIDSFFYEEDKYFLNLKNNIKLYLRGEKHSDYEVFDQIYNKEEYGIISSLLMNNVIDFGEQKTMIDAGANIGLTSCYLIDKELFSNVYCIEPSIENFEILNYNLYSREQLSVIKKYNKALAGKENLRFNLNNNFRSGKDWAISVEENNNGVVEGITINEIIKENNIETITLLKIDIEGAERFIFDINSDVSFLRKVKIIAIEIHDEFNIRDSINSIFKEYNFLIFESGELTVGINKNFVSFNQT